MTQPDLFQQINNAVLDLQSSDLQSYARPLKMLARLLQDPLLEAINQQLIVNVDLDAFLAESFKSQGGMVGSARLAWPDEPEKILGLTWLLILKFADNPDYMFDFGHTYYHSGSKIMASVHSVTRQMIIPFVRDYKTFVMTSGKTQPKLSMHLSKKVFIVHGHDGEARETVARYLQMLGFEPIILHERANKGRTVIEKIEANRDVGFAVVLLTPDDVGRAAKEADLKPRARQNVLLELGYFLCHLGRDRVCALKRGDVDIPSDFAGVVWENMDDGGGWRLKLARELKEAGHEVDLNQAM
ncbi:nucleotide-binding protein [Paraburkholderia bannensis]|uniref:nucleotide-binding protein n=1 Tax=Paraburkholderia bannensis TaxID=765414 RepID=UPI002AAF2B5D|nr:nucleotide-binding protein [Paraburkholderia bannensis]